MRIVHFVTAITLCLSAASYGEIIPSKLCMAVWDDGGLPFCSNLCIEVFDINDPGSVKDSQEVQYHDIAIKAIKAQLEGNFELYNELAATPVGKDIFDQWSAQMKENIPDDYEFGNIYAIGDTRCFVARSKNKENPKYSVLTLKKNKETGKIVWGNAVNSRDYLTRLILEANFTNKEKLNSCDGPYAIEFGDGPYKLKLHFNGSVFNKSNNQNQENDASVLLKFLSQIATEYSVLASKLGATPPNDILAAPETINLLGSLAPSSADRLKKQISNPEKLGELTEKLRDDIKYFANPTFVVDSGILKYVLTIDGDNVHLVTVKMEEGNMKIINFGRNTYLDVLFEGKEFQNFLKSL